MNVPIQLWRWFGVGALVGATFVFLICSYFEERREDKLASKIHEISATWEQVSEAYKKRAEACGCKVCEWEKFELDTEGRKP